jgi:hypothetical protein
MNSGRQVGKRQVLGPLLDSCVQRQWTCNTKYEGLTEEIDINFF